MMAGVGDPITSVSRADGSNTESGLTWEFGSMDTPRAAMAGALSSEPRLVGFHSLDLEIASDGGVSESAATSGDIAEGLADTEVVIRVRDESSWMKNRDKIEVLGGIDGEAGEIDFEVVTAGKNESGVVVVVLNDLDEL